LVKKEHSSFKGGERMPFLPICIIKRLIEMDKDNLHVPKVNILSLDKRGRATYMGDFVLAFKVHVVVGPYIKKLLRTIHLFFFQSMKRNPTNNVFWAHG
jgi:hypothetical protein